MSGFIQIIEVTTSRLDEMQAMHDAWQASAPPTGPDRISVCADRDRPGSYLTIVEFASYEQARQNSDDPTTHQWAEKMAALCDSPPVFRDLDVLRTDVQVGASRAKATTS